MKLTHHKISHVLDEASISIQGRSSPPINDTTLLSEFYSDVDVDDCDGE